MIKKILSIMLLGVLLSGNAYGKIINLEGCYDIKESKSFDNINFEEHSISINLNTSLLVYKMVFTKEYQEKVFGKKKFGNEIFEIINYDDRYIYSYKSEANVEINFTIDISQGYAYRNASLGSIEHNTTLKCNFNINDSDSEDAGGASGTAFFVSKKGHLLTNNHVVEGCSISKISYKNKNYDTKLIATDKNLDLALLKAEIRPKSFFNFSKDNVKKLNKVYVAGYPLGKGLSDDLKISSGIVSSLKGYKDNSNEIQIDAPINPGNSGGPIINENGDLIAIAVSGLAKDQTEGINFGIKSSAAELFLRSNKITPKKSMYSGMKDNDKLLEILEQGTVYTYCD